MWLLVHTLFARGLGIIKQTQNELLSHELNTKIPSVQLKLPVQKDNNSNSLRCNNKEQIRVFQL